MEDFIFRTEACIDGFCESGSVNYFCDCIRFKERMVSDFMRKKLLAAAVMGAVGAAVGICTAGAVEAAYVLDEVVVIGNRDEARDVLPGNFVYTKSQTSFLAGKDTMDVPFSQLHFTEKSMDTFTGPDKPMDALLANSPSVRQSGSILHGDFFSADSVQTEPTFM